jgi:uncharacterized protein (TIGR00290 family)
VLRSLLSAARPGTDPGATGTCPLGPERSPRVRQPIALSWSGGKDSTLALARLREDPSVEVVALLTAVTRGYERISIHGVRRAILEAQVDALGIPLETIDLPPGCDNATYQQAFAAGLGRLRARWPTLDTLAFGDLFLEDVRAYREALVGGLGWRTRYPIWGIDTTALVEEFIDRGFRAVLTCVDTTQLDARFAGRALDRALLADLPPTVDPAGERGEYHSLVYAGPLFAAPLALTRGESVLRDGRFQYCDFQLS